MHDGADLSHLGISYSQSAIGLMYKAVNSWADLFRNHLPADSAMQAAPAANHRDADRGRARRHRRPGPRPQGKKRVL